MKLPGWEKVTSAEQYREMIEAEYYRLQEQRAAAPSAGAGLEEIRLRLFLSLIEKPRRKEREHSTELEPKGAAVHAFPKATTSAEPRVSPLLYNDQSTPDQAA